MCVCGTDFNSNYMRSIAYGCDRAGVMGHSDGHKNKDRFSVAAVRTQSCCCAALCYILAKNAVVWGRQRSPFIGSAGINFVNCYSCCCCCRCLLLLSVVAAASWAIVKVFDVVVFICRSCKRRLYQILVTLHVAGPGAAFGPALSPEQR